MIIDFDGIDEPDLEESEIDDLEIVEPERKFRGPLILSALLIVGALYVQNTVAANVSLGGSNKGEFGQGVQVATACSGNSTLTLSPQSGFSNSSNSGTYYLSAVTVSDIPSSCNGVDFNLSAYDSSTSSALPLFNTNKTVATIWNDNGTFKVGSGSSGVSVTSGSGTFTVTFASPVAAASSVSRVTLQSTSHAAYSCVTDEICNLGETGPGGGVVFYYSAAGFNCGSGFTSTGSPSGGLCHYLEVAPPTWRGSAGTEATGVWYTNASGKQSLSVPGLTAYATDALTPSNQIGLGYYNTTQILNFQNDSGSAPGVARAYRGGGKSDWYLPTMVELNTLCKYAYSRSFVSASTSCGKPGGSSITSIKIGSGYGNTWYSTSTEVSATLLWYYGMSGDGDAGPRNDGSKMGGVVSRAIRAF